MNKSIALDPKAAIMEAFPDHVRENVALVRYSSARIGGPADLLVSVHSAKEFGEVAKWLWERDIDFLVLGGGSNVLISDQGVRGITIINNAKSIHFEEKENSCLVSAESGANLGALARQAAQKGWSGLEWAAGIPGTLGGAIVGNAGAHGGDMADVLILADILHREEGKRQYSVDELHFAYRTSHLKEIAGKAIVLAADLQLVKKDQAAIQTQMNEYLEHRKKSQPPGASMGSMFKNPVNDFAGRLIDEAGLKGKRIGDAQISEVHGNFFLNLGEAMAKDVYQLITDARLAVKERFGIELELEIGLIGEGFES